MLQTNLMSQNAAACKVRKHDLQAAVTYPYSMLSHVHLHDLEYRTDRHPTQGHHGLVMPMTIAHRLPKLGLIQETQCQTLIEITVKHEIFACMKFSRISRGGINSRKLDAREKLIL